MVEREYAMVVQPLPEDEGGGFIAFAPDLRGCMADGETQEEALSELRQAIGEWIDEAKRLKRRIPAPFGAGAWIGRVGLGACPSGISTALAGTISRAPSERPTTHSAPIAAAAANFSPIDVRVSVRPARLIWRSSAHGM